MTNLFDELVVNGILKDIRTCSENDALSGAILLTYCAMDAMAFLFMPKEKDFTDRNDFMSWVEKYMKTDSAQSYQYKKEDLYGARCGFAHRYGSESKMSRANQCKQLIYWGGEDHRYDPAINPDIAILSIKRFYQDFYDGVTQFVGDMIEDAELRTRVETRLPLLFRVTSTREQ